MNAKFSRLKSHFTNWREWEFNPVVIKELRQSVRSWAVTGMLLLFLAVLFITSIVFLVSQSFDRNPSQELGGPMFQTFAGILTFASVVFIPLYLGIRVAVERIDSNPDLLYISTLTPGRIIRGKFFCGAYMAMLFFSACMPFMAFTNLLRGVDLPSVFFILFFLFLVVCTVNMLAIFLACLPMSRPFKILLALYGLIQSFWIVVPVVFASYTMMRSGVGAMMSAGNFWIGCLTYGAIGFAVVGLLYVLSVALISPPSANRALAVRGYIMVVWLLGGILSLGWVVHTGEADWVLAWLLPTFILMMLALLVTLSNSNQLSLRVRRAIPASGCKRFFAFLFFNGAAGGLIWVAAILALTYLAAAAVRLAFPTSAATAGENGNGLATTAIYAFAYGLTALFIHRRFMPKRLPKLVGLLAVLLAAAWAIVPGIVLFFLNQLSWKSVEGLQLGNMFNVTSRLDATQQLMHFCFALGWLLLVLMLNLKWFLAQWKNFRPLPREVAPLPVIAEIPVISK